MVEGRRPTHLGACGGLLIGGQVDKASLQVLGSYLGGCIMGLAEVVYMICGGMCIRPWRLYHGTCEGSLYDMGECVEVCQVVGML